MPFSLLSTKWRIGLHPSYHSCFFNRSPIHCWSCFFRRRRWWFFSDLPLERSFARLLGLDLWLNFYGSSPFSPLNMGLNSAIGLLRYPVVMICTWASLSSCPLMPLIRFDFWAFFHPGYTFFEKAGRISNIHSLIWNYCWIVCYIYWEIT